MRKNKSVFNVGLKRALKKKPPADRSAAQRKTSKTRRAARARSEIAIYRKSRGISCEIK